MLLRRDFLKLGTLGMFSTGTFFTGHSFSPAFAAETTPNAAEANLMLTVQTWSFRLFDLDEGIRKTRQAGVKHIEIAGGIKLKGESKRASQMNADEKKWIRSVLEENEVIAISLGGCQGTPQEFEFANEMGLKYLQGEPPVENLVQVSQLAEKHQVRFTVHNHPKPSRYWNYKETLERVKDCTAWLGLCPDTGHMTRSGIDPLTAIRELKGKIYNIHLKDLDATLSPENPGEKLHDVPWGTGHGQVEAILNELVAQKVHAPVIIEYEYKWENNVPEIAECAKFFDKIVNKRA